MRHNEFGFCPDCGLRLPELTEDGRCEDRDACNGRVAGLEYELHVEAVRRETARLWLTRRAQRPEPNAQTFSVRMA